MPLQHLRSSTANKRPIPSGMSDGQFAINSNLASPGLFFKDSNGDLVKTGPVHVGTTAPNATPAVSGQTGNSKGEQWLDTSSGRYVFKIWDGTAWRSEDGEFVNASGDTMTGALVMDNRQQVRFRETTANGTNFVAIQAPASVVADRTLTLPDVTGTMVSTGDIGSVTSTMILDGTIVNADINASAAIAGTKISPNFGSQTITTTGVISSSLGAAGTPSIAFTGDLNTGIYSPGADQLAVATNGVERVEFGTSEVVFNNGGANYDFRVEGDTNANLFLVDASTDTVQVNGDITIADKIIHAGDTNTAIRFPAADVVAVETSGIERARITSTGRFLIGTPVDIGNGAFQVGQNTGTAATTVQTFSSNEASAHWLARSNANTIVAANDSIGTIDFRGYDGANYQTTALINSAVDGTPGTNDMPGRLVFSTTADGASSPTERMRIGSSGIVVVKTITDDILIGGSPGETISAVNRSGIHFAVSSIIPTTGVGVFADNTRDLGLPEYRWRVVYAGTGTINTSDGNEKQDIATLDTSELSVATAIKGLIKKYRFKSAVVEKGEGARIHVGVIAQDVEQAFINEGLSPRHYGMFCEDELEDGSKRLGIRYDELLAFVIAAQ